MNLLGNPSVNGDMFKDSKQLQYLCGILANIYREPLDLGVKYVNILYAKKCDFPVRIFVKRKHANDTSYIRIFKSRFVCYRLLKDIKRCG